MYAPGQLLGGILIMKQWWIKQSLIYAQFVNNCKPLIYSTVFNQVIPFLNIKTRFIPDIPPSRTPIRNSKTHRVALNGPAGATNLSCNPCKWQSGGQVQQINIQPAGGVREGDPRGRTKWPSARLAKWVPSGDREMVHCAGDILLFHRYHLHRLRQPCSGDVQGTHLLYVLCVDWYTKWHWRRRSRTWTNEFVFPFLDNSRNSVDADCDCGLGQALCHCCVGYRQASIGLVVPIVLIGLIFIALSPGSMNNFVWLALITAGSKNKDKQDSGPLGTIHGAWLYAIVSANCRIIADS